MKQDLTGVSRRNFLKNSLLTASLLPLADANLFAMPPANRKLKVHIFSKHLQFLDYSSMAEAAAELGFDGVDLTLRPKGHVTPERVMEDLPKAAEALTKAGLSPDFLTTAVGDAADPTDRRVLETAAKLGFKKYRMTWYPYAEGKQIPDEISRLAEKVKQLSLLNKELGLTGFYQNHAGMLVGASLWELWLLLENADKQHMGVQYDVRHAIVEGFSSWQNGLKLVHKNIKCLTIKDFKWGQKNGVWDIVDTPMGEGMIDFKKYFKLLKQYNIDVPVTLHMEYPLGGAEHGDRSLTINKKDLFKAMKKDLEKVHQLWQEA